MTSPAVCGGTCGSLTETRACGAPAVACVVSPWSNGPCSVTCGTGVLTRTRTVTTPASCNGAVCPSLSETASCSGPACGVDCVVALWSLWSACSQRCGAGTQTRSRDITTLPTGAGLACPELVESRGCNLGACSCVLSAWTAFGPCSVSVVSASCRVEGRWRVLTNLCSAVCAACAPCRLVSLAVDRRALIAGGGTHVRTRTIITPGVSCAALSETAACNTAPCNVDCVLSVWSAWSACSVTCGSGTRTATRTGSLAFVFARCFGVVEVAIARSGHIACRQRRRVRGAWTQRGM